MSEKRGVLVKFVVSHQNVEPVAVNPLKESRCPIAGMVSDHRLRRWPDTIPALRQRLPLCRQDMTIWVSPGQDLDNNHLRFAVFFQAVIKIAPV